MTIRHIWQAVYLNNPSQLYIVTWNWRTESNEKKGERAGQSQHCLQVLIKEIQNRDVHTLVCMLFGMSMKLEILQL